MCTQIAQLGANALPRLVRAVFVVWCLLVATLGLGVFWRSGGALWLALLVSLRHYLMFVLTVVQRPAIRSIAKRPDHWGVMLASLFWPFWLLWGATWVLPPEMPLSAWVPVQRGVWWLLDGWWPVAILQVLGEGLAIWALVSLGRGFGIVGAIRAFRTGGAYGWVRHPLYTAELLLGLVLAVRVGMTAAPTESSWPLWLWCGLAWGALVALTWVRLIHEEALWQTFPEYPAYVRRVPWRVVPGVV